MILTLFAGKRRAALIAGLLALTCAAATPALADGMQATATFTPAVIGVNAESDVTIRVVNDFGSTIAISLSTDALPALPDGLEFSSAPDLGDCSGDIEMQPGESCEMTAKVKALSPGIFDWWGTGEGNGYTLTLTSASAFLVYGDPAAVSVVSGFQSGRLNTAFTDPLIVQVVDSNGVLVPGVEVTFTPPADGPGATLSSTTAQTDDEGRASVTATANGFSGNYLINASIAGGASADFEMYNIPAPAKLETTVAWSESLVSVGSQFTANITLKNTSRATITKTLTFNGIPALPSGLEMVGSFDWGSCDGQVPIANNSICTMSATVRATATGKHYWTGAGTPADNTNTYIQFADADGIAVYGTPTTIVVNEGDNQSIPVGDGVETLSVLVKDANSIAVPGVEVTFTAPSTGASVTVTSKTANTDSDGQAGVNLVANGTTGDYQVEATIDGVNTSAVFHLSNTAGEAESLSATSGDNQAAKISTAFASVLVARVVDEHGNPVAGETVTFTAPADGASGAFANDLKTATSDADGYATSAIFTANASVGTYAVEASVPGASPVSFNLENTAGDVDPLPLPAITALTPSSGPEAGGTSVTITGSDLSGATSVTFGGVEADFELVDATIVAVSPAGTGSVDVLVTTPAGPSSATGGSKFSYDASIDPPPAPDSAEIDTVQDTFTPVVAQQSGASIIGSVSNAIRMGMSGGTQTSFSASEIFLAYGPTPAEPVTPFDDLLVDTSPSAADNVSIWLDTTGQGILPLSTTPERGWQVNITGGIGVRVTPDFLVGALVGRESFSYRSDDTGATLSGDGTSLGAYAGWDIGGRVLVSLGVVNTALDYRTSAGNASGAFQASRWLVTGDISGEYTLGDFTVQPSATLLGIWESQDGYTDTLAGTHDAREFGSASASAGIRLSRALPISEDWELTPYVGANLETSAEAAIGGDEATYGISGRLSAGAAITSDSDLYIGLDGGLSGIGTATLTWSARGAVQSSF